MSENKKWPFDKATTIALFALVVSFTQLILTTPILMSLYFSPNVTVTDLPSGNHDRNSVGFSVYNSGNEQAENVELSIIAGEKDQILVTPNLSAEISHDNDSWVRTFKVKVPFLAPEEGFAVIVHIDPESPRETGGATTDGTNYLQSNMIPAIIYFRSSEGPLEINAHRFEMGFVGSENNTRGEAKP